MIVQFPTKQAREQAGFIYDEITDTWYRSVHIEEYIAVVDGQGVSVHSTRKEAEIEVLKLRLQGRNAWVREFV